jgi:hypothetical protein
MGYDGMIDDGNALAESGQAGSLILLSTTGRKYCQFLELIFAYFLVILQ